MSWRIIKQFSSRKRRGREFSLKINVDPIRIKKNVIKKNVIKKKVLH